MVPQVSALVKIHEPVDPLVEAVEGALTDRTDAAVAKRDSLAETISSVTYMQF
ncbi:hypothetical protein [Haloferax sp. KTX1]|uniref:DUF7858 family protein n=1 Tax=Haloferax sp. KTX1 TaxID=2600597 RepID=UPI0016527E2F|nr:hypothetical protein [Haloferax sp. KTX1]